MDYQTFLRPREEQNASTKLSNSATEVQISKILSYPKAMKEDMGGGRTLYLNAQPDKSGEQFSGAEIQHQFKPGELPMGPGDNLLGMCNYHTLTLFIAYHCIPR